MFESVLTAWTGHEILLWGSLHQKVQPGQGIEMAGAAYDPAKRAWRRLPPNPIELTHFAGAWDGDRLVIAGYKSRDPRVRASAYRPESDDWAILPDVPFGTDSGVHLEVTAGSGELFVFNSRGAELFSISRGGSEWQRHPNFPFGRRRGGVVVFARRDLFVVGGGIIDGAHTIAPAEDEMAARYSPYRRAWTPLADPPETAALTSPVVVRDWIVFPFGSNRHGRTLSTNDAPPGAAFHLIKGDWFLTPGMPDRLASAPLSTGTSVLVWGRPLSFQKTVRYNTKGYELHVPHERPGF